MQKDDVTRERITSILELREILLSLQTGFNLVNTAVLCAILKSISGLEPSSVITTAIFAQKAISSYLIQNVASVSFHPFWAVKQHTNESYGRSRHNNKKRRRIRGKTVIVVTVLVVVAVVVVSS